MSDEIFRVSEAGPKRLPGWPVREFLAVSLAAGSHGGDNQRPEPRTKAVFVDPYEKRHLKVDTPVR